VLKYLPELPASQGGDISLGVSRVQGNSGIGYPDLDLNQHYGLLLSSAFFFQGTRGRKWHDRSISRRAQADDRQFEAVRISIPSTFLFLVIL